MLHFNHGLILFLFLEVAKNMSTRIQNNLVTVVIQICQIYRLIRQGKAVEILRKRATKIVWCSNRLGILPIGKILKRQETKLTSQPVKAEKAIIIREFFFFFFFLFK